jgi:CRP-like cAMP-binding protein
MPTWDPEKFFQSLPLFAGAPSAALRAFARSARRVPVAKGGAVFQEWETAGDAWWVAEGFVKIAKSTPQGRLLTMELLMRGDIFGAAPLMGFKTYPASALAVTSAAVVRASSTDVEALMRDCPGLAQRALQQVSQRLQRAHGLRALDAESADKKVAAALLWLREKTGDHIGVSRKEVSEIAGVAPETAIRVVLQFKERGWLEADARTIRLSRLKPLQDLVES